MTANSNPRAQPRAPSWAAFAIRLLLLLLPTGLLLPPTLEATGRSQLVLGLGAAFPLVVVGLGLFRWRRGRLPSSGLIIFLCLLAFVCLGLSAGQQEDWYPHLGQALLLLIPVIAFALQTLSKSGAPAQRRARRLARRLASRKDWPRELAACRNLPEVNAFREACLLDATPALNLLQHARLPVRLAALTALGCRRQWRPGQAELLLQVARSSDNPAMRTAAITALTHLEDRVLVETVANYLLDPSPEVRQAAIKAVLSDIEHRWSWIRHLVRQHLAHAAFQEDGPLRAEGRPLPPESVADLCAWTTEKGLLAVRAAQSLGSHYAHVLQEQPDQNLIEQLQRQAADCHTPAALRLELARLLLHLDRAEPALLGTLLGPVNPPSLRLLAVESLLSAGPHVQAQAALYDIARLANREIALAAALVAQRCLAVDFGLTLGQPLPEIHSRLAAEVTRRVLLWAAQPEARSQRSEVDLLVE